VSPFASLRVRLLVVVLVAVVPSLGIVWWSALGHRRVLMRQVEESAHDLAQLVAERHQRAVDGARGLLFGISRLPSVQRLDGRACSADLAPILSEARRYSNVGAVAPDGSMFCSAVPLKAPVNAGETPHVRGALRGEFVVGGCVLSRSRGVPNFALAQPVRDAAGNIVAAAFATLDLKWLQSELDALPMPEGAEFVVVDGSGAVITGRPSPGRRAGLPLDSRLLQPAAAGAVEAQALDGVRRVYGFHAVLGELGDPVMRVVVGVPAAAAYAPVNRIMRNSLLAFAAVALLALAMAALGGDVLVVRKLRAVGAAARRIAAGDYGARTGLQPGREEIGELARAFDDMAGSLDRLSRQNRLLLDAVGDGVVGIDRDGAIVFANPAAARALGWDPEEMLGKDAHALFHPRRADGTALPHGECHIQEAMLAGEAHEGAGEVLWRRDGSSFPVEYVSTPLVDGGRVLGVVMVFKDVSERLRLEERLRQAEKMEAIGQLAGGVAHDFNNLLTAIVSYAQIARDALPRGAPTQADLHEIEIAAGRAAALTRQLLAFSRRQRLAPRIIELRAVVRGMETMLRRLLPESVALHVETPAAGTVLADPAQIEMAVLNLAVNARDAMPSGGGIEIRIDEVEDAAAEDGELPPGPAAVLSVRDDGVGMDAATRERIFEPFFTTKPAGRGTGLGLSTVFGIVSQSGGAIRVHSEPGSGAEFRVYLPRRERPAAEPDGGRPGTAPGAGFETILLAEDDDAIRVIARRSLGAAGYRVLDAASAGDALQIAQGGEHVDLLVTDVILPGRNGWELSVELSRARPGLRVLFMSGYAAQHGGGALLPDGVPFLEKPFTPDDLLRAVRATLDGAPGAQTVAAAESRAASAKRSA
jgi:PAS domain S-box-containing protein